MVITNSLWPSASAQVNLPLATLRVAFINSSPAWERFISLDNIFDTLRPVLVDLRSRVLDRPPASEITGYFPIDKQRDLCNEVAETFGYDFSRGRIDTAVHPFCSGTGNDVRITTRFDENDPLGSIYSTIHEVGHALYEQNIDPIYSFSNIGRGVSMGVHESQSRILENQLGRSESLADWLFKKFFDYFGDIGCKDSSSFYKSINSVWMVFTLYSF